MGRKPLSIDEVHELLVEMMDAFVAFCEKHGLRYYLVGGTLLGAIRHNGFIPWDDDVDVGMPRKDYERFLRLTGKEPIGRNLIVRSGEKGTLSLPYAELIRTDTYLVRETAEYIEARYQVRQLFVDIFPQDAWPDTDEEGRRLVRKLERYNWWILKSRARAFHGTSFFRSLMKTPAVAAAHLYRNKRFVAELIRLARSFGDYDEAHYVGSLTSCLDGMGERCDGAATRELALHDFEGRKFYIPGSFDAYLRGKYGDYMRLPPVGERGTHRMRVYRK